MQSNARSVESALNHLDRSWRSTVTALGYLKKEIPDLPEETVAALEVAVQYIKSAITYVENTRAHP